MQKMWAIAAITLVGLMMIISSIPQDAFAGKDTVRLSLKITDGGVKEKNVDCASSLNGKDFGTPVSSGNSAKVTFEFNESVTSVFVKCDGGFPLEFGLDGKNTRATYDLKDEPA